MTPASSCETWQDTQLGWGQWGKKLHPAMTLTENSQTLQGHPSAVDILNIEPSTELGKTMNPTVVWDETAGAFPSWWPGSEEEDGEGRAQRKDSKAQLQ